jgi:hypothetical protein
MPDLNVSKQISPRLLSSFRGRASDQPLGITTKENRKKGFNH